MKKNLMYKLKKIGELMGERTVFRVGVDIKTGRIDLLSADICRPEEEEEKIIIEIPEYIG